MGQTANFRHTYDLISDDDEYEYPLLNNAKMDGPIRDYSKEEEASLLSGIGNLSNTILGSGMLGLPFALASAGVVVGAILFILASLATMFTLHLLTLSAQLTAPNSKSSYFDLAKMTFPKLALLTDFAIAIKSIGVALSYLIVFSTLMPEAMQYFSIPSDSILLQRYFWILISIIPCVPLSLLKSLNSLRFTSYVAIASVAYIFGLVIYFFVTSGRSVDYEKIQFGPTTVENFFSNIPIFIFAFTCHQNLLGIRNEMIGVPQRIQTTIISSSLFALSVYVMLGYCGYFTYGSKIKPNIISNLPQEASVVVCRLAVSVLVAFSYPLQTHPCRNSLINLASAVTSKAGSPFFFYGVSILVCTVTYVVVFFVDDLGIVFSIVGATGSVSICYILPSLFYVKLVWEESWHAKKVLAMFMICSGILLMINSLIWITVREINKEQNI